MRALEWRDALGKRLCQEGHPTQFLPVNFLFEEIQAAKAAGRYLNYVRSLIKGYPRTKMGGCFL